VNDLDASVARLEAKVAGIDAKVAVLDMAFVTFRNLQLHENERLFQTISTVTKGLGLGFEGFNAAWLQQMLATRGHSDDTVQRRVMVPNPERTVH
jgi:hypothetical protein